MTTLSRDQMETLSCDFTVARALSENPHCPALLLTPDGIISDLNPQMSDSLGRPMADLKGTLLWPHLPPDGCVLHQALVRRVVEDRQPYRQDTQQNGRRYDWWFMPCMDDVGGVIGLVVVAWDITERKLAKEAPQIAARASEQLRKAIIAINACPDLDSGLAYLVQAATEIGGMGCGAVYVIEGEHAVLRHHRGFEPQLTCAVARRPLSAGYIRAALEHPREIVSVAGQFPEQIELGGVYGLRHVHCVALVAEKRPFGLLTLASRRAEPPSGSDIETIRILAMEVESLFLRLGVEERLRQSQKMEGIGHLAGGMAHEFNNILTPMMVDLRLVQMFGAAAGAHDRGQDLLREMEALSRRAADLIKQLLAFSRHSVMQLRPMDLAATVSRQCEMLSRLLGGRITLEFSSTDDLPWVIADRTMIEQVLLNLCLNARDALRNGGQIRFHLAAAEISAEQAKAQDGGAPGRYVCLAVADTGCGMDEETMKRLFEPFFTTKEVGQGTGLGLATSRWMVQQHHGWTEVESCVGKGSTFRVYLPAVAQPQTGAR
jgi:signal transduction histidine kinase